MIWPAVAEVFFRWNARYEGVVYCLYADILGLATTGVGNLVPDLFTSLQLPWKHADGTPATPEEIEEAWFSIQKNMEAAKKGAAYACTLTDLRLTEEDVEVLVAWRLEQMAEHLVKRFPDFPDWPADAQLATLSMAWAMGPGFKFPKFEAAVKAYDFRAAAEESAINATGNPGVVPRNAENKRLFLAAADRLDEGADPSRLSFDYSGLVPPKGIGGAAAGGGSGGSGEDSGFTAGDAATAGAIAALGVGLAAVTLGPGAVLAPFEHLGDAARTLWRRLRGR
jgi:GH24 family phage-related lysozyme (muramidase)